jgi:AcrR family transcriptional regulator
MASAADSSEPTRDAILDAAEELFSHKGFTATTIKQIGRASATNPALLYYYFGSKESLYRAVIDRLAEQLVARGTASLGEARTAEDAVRGIVEAQAAFLRQHPCAPALMIREMLDHGARHADQFIPRVSSQLFQRLCGHIEAGQKAGRFRQDFDPRFAAISTISQIIYLHLAKPAAFVLLHQPAPDFPTPELQERFARHAAEFAVAAMR